MTMRQARGATLIAALALAGCGGGSRSTPASTSAEPAKSSLQSIVLESPAMAGSEAIPTRYTCDGRDVSPPLRWRLVPPATRELLLLVLSVNPRAGTRTVEGNTVEWAVAGLRPRLHGLAEGRLPRGAIVGRNARGRTRYGICPPKGEPAAYLILLFASPSRLSLPPDFSDEALFAELSRLKPPYGQISATYTRA
jgi:phosphatidylethanolamine-binding protein (PEBP) family uncharacterized protein